MSIGFDISIAALGAGVIGTGIAILNQVTNRRKQREERVRGEFAATREYLKARRGALAILAVANQQSFQSDGDIPLLTKPGWIPSRPLLLSDVVLRLRESSQEGERLLVEARSRLLPYWPLDENGQRPEKYSQAIVEYDKAARMEDRPSYRLTDVLFDKSSPLTPGLIFARASYFDGIDLSESLAYETALRVRRDRKAPMSGPYRSWLSDPFRLDKRVALPGINTLTIRLSEAGPSFFMHKRGFNAGVSMGVYHVAPAGEFQPHIDDPTIWDSDLNLLYNIIREYAEEFLGAAEADGGGGVAIDYDRDPPYSYFSRAFRQGKMKVYYLGVGIDPLSWKPEILTACVFEGPTFDKIFRGMVTDKIDEGTGGFMLAGKKRKGSDGTGRSYEGLAFNAANTAPFTDLATTLPAGAACITLAARRASLIIP